MAGAWAQDSGALLNVLVRKGILTDQEAEDVRAELTAESHAAVISSVSGGKSTHSLAISGRLQVQFAGLDSDGPGMVSTNHFFVRRIYFGAKAGLGANWTANLVYDIAGGGFDKAYIEYADRLGDMPFAIDVGLRKVNLGMDEWTSSGSLDAIERSGATRYFVEGNNGRRLGAGSYHVGVFLEGNPNARAQKADGLFWGAAITNPERTEDFSSATSAGNSLTNLQAYWADIGYSGSAAGEGGATYRLGAAVGLLPDQGGRTGAAGSDLSVFDLYGNVAFGNFKFAAEYLSAEVDDGIAAGVDASPYGYWLQPSFAFSEAWELVGRYSFTSSDNRGIKVSDGVRSAPASLTGDNLAEYFLGMNYYFLGNDLKLQFGYVRGTAERGGTEETAEGVRSQMQVNF